MFKTTRPILASMALLASTSISAFAADPYVPPPPEPQPPVVYEEPRSEFGGWYIRGDVDYHWMNTAGDITYTTYPGGGAPPVFNNTFTTADLRGSWSVGAGVGYQVNHWFRADVTLDYWAKADFRGSTTGVCGGVPCTSVDESALSAWLLLANAYVDLGTYHGITPYVGAGFGTAYVQWDDLRNTVGGITTIHHGRFDWRFAAALMVGASYCLTDNLDLDVGYRYTRITGGEMFNFAVGAGPGRDDGFHVHEARAGLRWNIGGYASRCAPPPPPPQVVDYIPPVYK